MLNQNQVVKRQQKGISLIEVVVSIVVLAISVTGLLSVITHENKQSADPMIEAQMIAIAETYLEQLVATPYASINSFTDVQAQDQFGNTPAELTGYQVVVTVTNESLNPGAIVSKRIDILVSHTGNGHSKQIVTHRTDYR
ncbi:MAG: hypothetical protein HON94_00195 [Methylococcales bacterium]|jgi:Tfp pilus assembly protein PilV|nr:hypothetical protein [Methylococcales bacterium]MBT7408695.1 hypothetical protein [Methylococcales bacterium]